MATIKTKKAHYRNSPVIFPIIGKKTANDQGEIEVEDDEVAAQVVALVSDFFIVGSTSELVKAAADAEVENLGEKSEKNELNKVKHEDVKLSADERNELIAALNDATLADLKEQARPFPGAEWRTLNKAELTAYLISKIN